MAPLPRTLSSHYQTPPTTHTHSLLSTYATQTTAHPHHTAYATPPPPITADNPFNPNNDARYADIDPPLAECLADVVDRMLPYWEEAIAPDLHTGHVVLVAAHGNSLRAMCKFLDGISDDAIADLNIPTGTPLVYELDDDLCPVEAKPVLERSLDPAAAAAAAAAVAAQAG